LTGKILNSISEAGFKISALEMFNVDPANAEEFYEVYKGVVTEYPSMVTELCSGPCMVLEIHGTDVSKSFREFCGPSDPVSTSGILIIFYTSSSQLYMKNNTFNMCFKVQSSK
ncbi:Nucleoside diphosphate kinase 7, partial [Ilyodon furcidens]